MDQDFLYWIEYVQCCQNYKIINFVTIQYCIKYNDGSHQVQNRLINPIHIIYQWIINKYYYNNKTKVNYNTKNNCNNHCHNNVIAIMIIIIIIRNIKALFLCIQLFDFILCSNKSVRVCNILNVPLKLNKIKVFIFVIN